MMPLWAWKLIGAAVIALTLMGVGAKLMSIWDAGKIASYQKTIAHQTAVVKQVTAVTNQITKADQAQEVAAQGKITVQTKTITKELTRYVPEPGPTVTVPCVSVGMLRVHDAAVAGVDPGEVVPSAGQSDDACSATSASDFMGVVVRNYGAARQNAEQLNALEADIKSREAAVAAAGKSE